MSKPSPNLTCTIDRFEGSKAVLLFAFNNHHHQELIVPKNLLPRDIREGSILKAEFLTEPQAAERQKNLAREILKEILSGGK